MTESAAREEGHIVIKSLYGDNIELFDNENSLSDLLFVFGERERKTLRLHRGIIARSSLLAQGMLKIKEEANNPDKNQMGWIFDTDKPVDRDALVKALRFCYGEAMNVGTHDCCAVIAALSRLQVTCLNEVVKELTAFAVDQANKDAKVGAELLMATQDYFECRNANVCNLDEVLARVVFTAKNLHDNYEDVVQNCLMELPQQYLEFVEFGEPHTQYSDFNVRMQYVKCHKEDPSVNAEELLINKCDWTNLSADELKELKDVVTSGSEIIVAIGMKVVERTRNEEGELQARMDLAVAGLEVMINACSSTLKETKEARDECTRQRDLADIAENERQLTQKKGKQRWSHRSMTFKLIFVYHLFCNR